MLAIVGDEGRAETLARTARPFTRGTVLHLPPSDALPGEGASASPAVSGQRAAVLRTLSEADRAPVLLIADVSAALGRLPAPPEPHRIAAGEPFDPDAFAAALEPLGYWADDRVDEPGEYAVRAEVADLFPADAAMPVRLLVLDGAVTGLSAYDPVSQLGTGEALDAVVLPSAREAAARGGDPSLFDLLPDARLALDPQLAARRDRALAIAAEEGAGANMLDAAAWDASVVGREMVELAAGDERPGHRFVEERRPARALLAAVEEAREQGGRVLLVGGARDLRFLVRDAERRLGAPVGAVPDLAALAPTPPGTVAQLVGELDAGWSEPGLLVIAAADVLGARAERAEAPAHAPVWGEDAGELRVGDAVIHEDHGLGMVTGLERVGDGEAIRLEHAGGAARLVPAEEAQRLWRYGGDAEGLTLDKLDGSSWEKRRGEIDAAVAQTARRLVELADERAAASAPILDPPAADIERFASGFRYTETPDQARAIAAVRVDLLSGKPMNRLVVGDVGYGKTEVALRAAAQAVLGGKQAAVVAPTTVLVRQHLELFRRRFAPFGIEVADLSRLGTPAEVKRVKAGLTDGSVRLVIGTTALAGKGVSFADLGLVVIDEEQRFGAADKAKVAALGDGVHVLSMSATPIPRTLQAALVGLQDMSVIATPPARRRPTRTSVAAWDDRAVQAALRRERARGGQSFVVVPRIEDMAGVAVTLGRLVPELTVVQAHGKMPIADSDAALVGFADGRGDILLATNIIEAGLDIPRANTMVILHADRFGLAQLHQLRGRVGRGRSRGAMLLTTDPGTTLSPATAKRLAAMSALEGLGAGFAVSARDLDLRGAGDLLGEEQAGHMKLVGLGLYQHLLGLAVRQARGETVEDWTPELNGIAPGRVPDDWVPEVEPRLNLYVRLARLMDAAGVDVLADELADRFGPLPPEAEALMASARVRQLARAAGVARVDAGPAAIALTPHPAHEVEGEKAGLTKSGERWLLKEALPDEAARVERLAELLDALAT